MHQSAEIEKCQSLEYHIRLLPRPARQEGMEEQPREIQAGEGSPHWLSRAVFLRGLGCIYLVAFLALAQQVRALLGSDGLTPIDLYLTRLRLHSAGFFSAPSLFWLALDDSLLVSLAWAGVGLSATVILGGATSVSLFVLWALYLSYVNVGQIWLGYGWETLLLESGFLAIFLAPAFRPGEFSRANPPNSILFFLLYWLLFRLMFGAGMIKIHGDECWRELTCLDYHFETQPLPNPLSWLFHRLPHPLLRGGVLFNHLVELIAPWLLFFGRRFRRWALLAIILFQTTLILSGNLSWLNYLTIVLAIGCFDDHSWWLIAPRRWKERFLATPPGRGSKTRRVCVAAYALLVALHSVSPAVNMFSSQQLMNASFDPFHLVNTYGAFGSVGKERYEIILQGTDAELLDERTIWKDYEFPCKPGALARRPCVIAPYQLRLDWQIWFAATERAHGIG